MNSDQSYVEEANKSSDDDDKDDDLLKEHTRNKHYESKNDLESVYPFARDDT